MTVPTGPVEHGTRTRRTTPDWNRRTGQRSTTSHNPP